MYCCMLLSGLSIYCDETNIKNTKHKNYGTPLSTCRMNTEPVNEQVRARLFSNW